MTLLDDFKIILSEMRYEGLVDRVGPEGEDWPTCRFCNVDIPDPDLRPHKSGCPNLSMPKIIAALELAYLLAPRCPETEKSECFYCLGGPGWHNKGCMWKSFVDALEVAHTSDA